MGASITTRELGRCPDLSRLHELNPERYPFLLESAAHGTPQGLYDILFAFPGKTICLEGDRVDGQANRDFLRAFDRAFVAERIWGVPADLPFTGGWFLYLGYELAQQIEPTLRLPRYDGFPTALAVRVPAALVRNRRTQHVCLVTERGHEHRADQILADLDGLDGDQTPQPQGDRQMLVDGTLIEEPASRYVAAVQTARQHIADGDVFQANLSREWRARLTPGLSDAVLYRCLRDANPGPFAGLAVWGDAAIISSSPERLVRVRAGTIETRPIAGTRPRGATAEEDAALCEELIAHPKERAEHIMLIDLERNDLGRVCRPGTVEADEVMVVETYAHVHHIVSNVRGVLRHGVSPGESLRAVFPGGTITGCPKVRCMQLIADLEGTGRGPYTGSMGYVNRDGSCDLNILIRSFVRQGRHVSLRAGAGIVADSDPHREVEETRAKARGLLMSLGIEP